MKVSGTISRTRICASLAQKEISGAISQKGVTGCIGEGGYSFVWPYLISLMDYLWVGYTVGNHLISAIDGRYITVNGMDFTGNVIPETTTSTFTLPNDADFILDDSDNCWFTGGVSKNNTFSDLNTDFSRTIILRPNTSPYTFTAIGLLKSTTVLTLAQRNQIASDFLLWILWNEIN